jgi:hypothetical protein
VVDRTSRPIVPVEHADEREHRRELAVRANAAFPKDGTEGMTAPLRLMSYTTAGLPSAALYPGAMVFNSTTGIVSFSDGVNWVAFPGFTATDFLGVYAYIIDFGAVPGHFDLYQSDAGVSGPEFIFRHNSASPAAGDGVGVVRFYGKDSAANDQLYGLIRCQITNATSGSETSEFDFQAPAVGALKTVASFGRVTTGANVTNNLYMTASDPGSHSTSQHRVAQIVSTPVGSGGNGVANSDVGMGVFVQKQSYSTPASATIGEIDGFAVTVQNGGPDGFGTPANRSDTAAILIGADIYGTPGGVSQYEGFSTCYSAAGVLNSQVYCSMGIQFPAGSPTYASGFQAVAWDGAGLGANDTAYIAADSSGAWDYAFGVGAVGSYDFSIDMNGKLSWASGRITIDNPSGQNLYIRNVSAGANGPIIKIYQNSASPAALDEISRVVFTGNNASAVEKDYVTIRGFSASVAAGAEQGQMNVDMLIGGAVTTTFSVANGMTIGAPAGGFKGTGTLNCAADVYKNNTAYTNPDYALEHWATGKIEQYADNDGASEYQGLVPLSDLAEFMRTKLRLPGIDREPMGAFERMDKVLEKVEEAFIYITQLSERLSALEERVGAGQPRTAK